MLKYIVVIIVSFGLGAMYYSSLDQHTYSVVIQNNSGMTIKSLTLTYTNEFCINCQLLVENLKSKDQRIIMFQNDNKGTYEMKVNLDNGTELTNASSFEGSGAQKVNIVSDQINTQKLSLIGLILARNNY